MIFRIKTKSQNVLTYENWFKSDRSHRVWISYKGPINEVLIMEMGTAIRRKLKAHPKVSAKLFSIFIELVQNVVKYSQERSTCFDQKPQAIGSILLLESETSYLLSTGNLVNPAHVSELKRRCQHLNSLNREALRELKKDQRLKSMEQAQPEPANGLGLIKVALQSSGPLLTSFSKANGSLGAFYLSVNVEKSSS